MFITFYFVRKACRLMSQHALVVYFHSFISVTQSCPTLCDPMDCSTPGFPVHHQLWELAQTHVHWVDDAIQPSHHLCPLLLLPSVCPSIRVFINESVSCIRWLKYWNFSINPSNEYSGLTSFSIDCTWDFPGKNTGVGCHALLPGIKPGSLKSPA